MSGTVDKPKPGQILAKILNEMPPQDRPQFLDHLERKYRAESDLMMLRELKAYHEMSRFSPTSTKPPESA
jgi:hypothetical protein